MDANRNSRNFRPKSHTPLLGFVVNFFCTGCVQISATN